MVTVTAGRRPDPRASTTSSGTGMPVAVLPPSSTVERNFIGSSPWQECSTMADAGGSVADEDVLGTGELLDAGSSAPPAEAPLLVAAERHRRRRRRERVDGHRAHLEGGGHPMGA